MFYKTPIPIDIKHSISVLAEYKNLFTENRKTFVFSKHSVVFYSVPSLLHWYLCACRKQKPVHGVRPPLESFDDDSKSQS